MGLLAGIIPLIIGLIACGGALQLEIGQWNKPGAGLWPFLLSVALIVCAGLLFLKDVRPDRYEKFGAQSKPVLLSALAVIVFIGLFQTLGLPVAAIALLIFQLRVVGREPWKVTLTVAIGMSSVIYLLFSVWLKIPFPGLLS